jgi:hypothetical protein
MACFGRLARAFRYDHRVCASIAKLGPELDLTGLARSCAHGDTPRPALVASNQGFT